MPWAACGPWIRFATQVQQLGTGHAVKVAADTVKSLAADTIAVMYGDMPLLPSETMKALAGERERSGAAIAMLTLIADNSRGFGRVVRNGEGAVTAIVEAGGSRPEHPIRELNVGYCFDAAWLWPALERIQPNARKGEYFLTDLVEIAIADGRQVIAIPSDNADAFIGINTRADLADADAILRRQINRGWMLKGVSMVDPASVYIDDEVVLAPDVTVLPNTHLLGDTRIGTGSVIGPNCVLRNAAIGRGAWCSNHDRRFHLRTAQTPICPAAAAPESARERTLGTSPRSRTHPGGRWATSATLAMRRWERRPISAPASSPVLSTGSETTHDRRRGIRRVRYHAGCAGHDRRSRADGRGRGRDP
jgi:bifunctional UDP-N-acetylglucosamine pyrophosphorylase/glucosamine-1-phosphate N-acetyltransferase